MADSLRDLGEPIIDRTLVLNLLCGLSPPYDHLKALIKWIVPFSTFHVMCNELLLEELTMEMKNPVAEPPELSQLKCPSPALEATTHLNRNKPSVPRI
jgi:hypothetical protein